MQGEDDGQCALLPSKGAYSYQERTRVMPWKFANASAIDFDSCKCTIAIAILRKDKRIFDKFMGSGQESMGR